MTTPPTTADSPTLLAILPDWADGIRQTISHRTGVQRMWGGTESRQRQAIQAIATMEYSAATLDAADLAAFETVIASSRGPLVVPWWPSGIQTAVDMPDATTVVLDGLPNAGFEAGAHLYLWSRQNGGEWREIASRTGLTITLTGTGTIYAAAAWAFPGILATMEPTDSAAESGTDRSTRHRLTFRQA